MGASKRSFMKYRRTLKGYYPSYRELNRQPILKNQYGGKRNEKSKS
jgi:hypothetical protein